MSHAARKDPVAVTSATIVSIGKLNSLVKGVAKRPRTGIELAIFRLQGKHHYPLSHQALTVSLIPHVLSHISYTIPPPAPISPSFPFTTQHTSMSYVHIDYLRFILRHHKIYISCSKHNFCFSHLHLYFWLNIIVHYFDVLFYFQRHVYSALSQIAKHNVDLAEMVVEAEIFPSVLSGLKDPDEYVKKNTATLIREIAKHTPEVRI